MSHQTPTQEFLPYLMVCLNDSNLNRERVIASIANLGSDSVPVLIAQCTKAGESEKKSILIALSKIGDRRSIEFILDSMLKKPEIDYLKFACYVLKCIFRSSPSSHSDLKFPPIPL